ncbi:MAG: M14 family metallopeptidase, partial [Bacteroidota bacterium]
MNSRFALLLLLLVYLSDTTAQSTIYSQVKIDLTKTSIQTIAQLGLEYDHGSYAPGKHLINTYSQAELAQLDAALVDYEILIPDAKADYFRRVNLEHQHPHVHAKSNNDDCGSSLFFDYPTPVNYQDGSMGGYLTYDELLATLDSMAAKYPNLITPKTQIDNFSSNEGRPIYFLRLSDNPLIEEEDEPELLYTALHHAREPNSLAQMIFYIWYLLENYGTDPEVTYLVDNTELYFIPCINPDGYVYNELTDPSGGGFWRKNRRQNTDGSVGVDLNRNYGFEWGYDDFGSSPTPGAETFRGTEAFSEPETQAVRQLCITHDFRITLNYHTFGNLLIYPWGFEDGPTPDQPTFRAFGEAMTRENEYFAGTGLETVGYTVNGDSDDWMYGDSLSKPRIFSLTPEVGPRFWPTPGEIDQLNKACMKQNLVAAHLLHNYGEVEEINGSPLVTILSDSLDLNLKKYGLEDGALTVSVFGADNAITMVGNNTFTDDLTHLEEANFSLDFLIDDQTPNGAELNFVVSIDNGEIILTDTLRKTYQVQTGITTVVINDDASSLTNWTPSSGWDITTEDFVSAPSSITDSPETDYPADADNSLRLNTPIDLSQAEAAFIEYEARWNIENNYDYAQIMASTDGLGWQALCGI